MVGRRCQREYGRLPYFSELKGSAGDDEEAAACISAVRTHIPSLSGWQGAAALLLSLRCRVYPAVASILLRFFIPSTLSAVHSRVVAAVLGAGGGCMWRCNAPTSYHSSNVARQPGFWLSDS